jgi:dolichyl-phosphate beta-glucosyltransferase
MVSLVVPCYNEADRLPVSNFHVFYETNPGVRLVFVDDGSRDGTRDLLEGLARRCPERVAVLRKEPNQGKGEAVRTGVLHSIEQFRPDAVGFWDADLATPLDAVGRFVEVLKARPEIEMVFGSRVMLLGRNVKRKPMRHYLGRVFATAVSTMLRLPIYDTQCGAKLFRVEPHTRAIFAEPFLSRWVFDVEIIARYLGHYGRDAERMCQLIYEYPLETWVDVAGSKVHPTDFFKALGDIVRIERRYLSRAKS